MERPRPGETYLDIRRRRLNEIQAAVLVGFKNGDAPQAVLGTANEGLKDLLPGRDTSRIRTLIEYAQAGMEIVTDTAGRSAIGVQIGYMNNALEQLVRTPKQLPSGK